MNARGDAIVAWTGEDFGLPAIEYRTRPAGGTFSADAFVTRNTGLPGPSYDDQSPAVAIDAAGNAMLAWEDNPAGSFEHDVMAAYRPAGANTSFDPAHFQDVSQGGGLIANDYRDPLPAPSLSMDAAGDAILAWNQSYSSASTPNAGNCPEAAFRPAGGDPAHPLDPGFGPKTTLFASTFSGGSSSPWTVSTGIDDQGNALVAYAPSTTSDPLPPQVHERYRPHAASGWNADTILGPGQFPAGAFDPSGNASLLWQAGGQVQSAYQPAGASFGTPTAVQPPGDPVSAGPELGIDSQGRQAALWALSSGGGDTVQASSRDAAPGAWAAPANLMTGDLNGSEPALSMSASGQAVAVWPSAANGDELVYAAFGTPPGSSPPPPPPPPPPPAPTSIVIAGHYTPGGPIVLTANVPSDTQRLQWQLGGGSGPIGTVVNGRLQDSVRLRPTSRNLGVRVTADGPAGEHVYSAAFILPKFPALSRDEQRIHNALSGTPAVYGVGDATTLLGHNACGAVTVYSDNQQVSGCMRPINVLSDIPSQERGAIQTMARDLGLDPNDAGLMSEAMQEVDGYIGVGPTTVAGKWPVVPNPGASVISFPGVGALTSSHASLNVGGIKFGGLPGGFSLNINPSKLDIPLGSLPKPSLPDIGGFPLVGNWNIDLGDSDATIDTDLQLPSWLSIGGVPLHIPITFKATPTGLVLDSLNVGPLNANLGPLNVTGLHLTYDRPSDTWTGSGKVCLLTGVCLDMSPPNGEVKIVHGALNFAGATLDFPPPGVPLFTGVNLTNIGFGIGLDPTRLKASAGISVLDLVQLNGELIAAFPTADHPFVLARDEVGNDFPAALYGQPFHEPTIGAAADVLVNLPGLGYVKLGSGYLLYEVPDFIALGGAAGFTVPHVFEIGGSIAGAANFSDHTLNLNAELHACLLLVGKVCASAVVDISKAPNSGGGAGGCVDVAGFHIGGGVLWKGYKIVVWPFDGCKWSRFKVDVRPSIASAAAATRTIVVRRGQPNPALKLYGDGAAPLVRVTGPGGQQLDSTSNGFDHSPGGHIRILRYEGTSEDFTVVGLERAKPGTYTVSTLPGSVPFTEIDSATDPPDPKVTAHITGSGERRLLTYDIRKRPDQTVSFWDTNPGGAATRIGHVNGGGKGQIRFTAPPGDRRRTIYAQFTLNGLPAERMTVGSYKPPAPTLPRPRDVRASRHQSRIIVSWKPVAGATGYEVVLTDRLTGAQRITRTRRHHVVLTKVPPTVGGVISVRAVEPRYARASLTTSAQIKRLAMPKSHFAKLGKCKLSKHGHKLSCTGGPPVKHRPKPKKHHKPPKHHKH
jgi:hypothetical protein